MISFELSVEDLADTRFAISPLNETIFSLRVLRDPGLHALHLPWRRSALARLDPADAALLVSVVGEKLALPDFLTPRPAVFAPSFDEELAIVRRTPPHVVRHDLEAALVAEPLPEDDAAAARLRDDVCDALARL